MQFRRPAAQAQHELDEQALAMYDHSQGAAILSPTPRALTFPSHPMLDISLDGPTPRAFTFPSSVHDSFSNANRGPPLTPPEPSPSTPSTSPSPFEPERVQNASQPQLQQVGQPQFTAPHIARRSQSMQRERADTASPAAQISSFNAPEANPGAPLTLAACLRCSPISLLPIPSSHSHTLNVHFYLLSSRQISVRAYAKRVMGHQEAFQWRRRVVSLDIVHERGYRPIVDGVLLGLHH